MNPEGRPAPPASTTRAVGGGRFRLSFQNKIVALLILLIAVTQLATFTVVNVATGRSVRTQLERDLDVGERVWQRFHESRGRQLLDSVGLLSDDFGFKEAVASGDQPTMVSALGNHAARIGADASLLLSPDGDLLASQSPGSEAEQAAALAPLIATARHEGFAYGVVVLDDGAYQIAVVPMLAPNQIAWVAVGTSFGEDVTRDYHAITGLDASIARIAAGRLRIDASSLATEQSASLATLPSSVWADADVSDTSSRDENSERFLRGVTVSAKGAAPVLVLLQGSLQTAMAPFEQLKTRILGLSALAAVLALLVAGAVGRGVSRPVSELAGAAIRIEQGDYTRPVAAKGQDELARLANVFNRMQDGIAQREERIVHQANHDGLTGLPNRSKALIELETAIARARAIAGHCTVLMLDVDRFKEINDTLGHDFGDQVLVEVAKCLRATVRPQDFVARLGGDEFLVLMEGVGPEQALLRATELGASLRAPLQLPSTLINLDVSIGVAIHPQHAADAETLLRRVDIAMYEAKTLHAGVALYIPGRDELHLRQLTLMAELRRSIERRELHVVFQPKVEIASGAVRHAEALLRWNHAQLGPVAPDEFIPLAERSGFVHELSRFVLDESIRQCQSWRGEGLDLSVAVNLSAMDLMDSEMPDYVYDCLHRHRMEPSRLILEVTESALMRDVNYAIRVLQRLRAGGVRISIDDFGTGHSSLAQLKKLPVDELKIDKSFILQLAQDEDDAVIVRATIDLGHHMGLLVIAEGVEDARSYELLRDYGCDLVQGYLFSRPLKSVEFVAWCQQHARESHAVV